jgi:hypothetical protein
MLRDHCQLHADIFRMAAHATFRLQRDDSQAKMSIRQSLEINPSRPAPWQYRVIVDIGIEQGKLLRGFEFSFPCASHDPAIHEHG